MKRTPTRLSAAAIVLALGACERGAPSSPDTSTATEAEPKTSEVLVLGMIHDGHRESATYGVDVIKEIVRAVDPDYVLAEIPPDRLDAALDSYRAAGAVDEDRVERFPEYTDTIIPLTTEMGFQIIPCAAWTREMADARRAKLAEREARRARSVSARRFRGGRARPDERRCDDHRRRPRRDDVTLLSLEAFVGE